MTHTVSIYVFDNQLVFCGILDMYFEKYKGVGPGLYSNPILCLSRHCTVSDIENALQKCESVLLENEGIIFQENIANNFMQMENLLFRNFKLFGIKASRSTIIKSSILVEVRRSEHPEICRCIPKGRNMIVQQNVKISIDTPLSQIADLVMEFLGY